MGARRRVELATAQVIEGVRLDKANPELVTAAYKLAVKAFERMAAPPMRLPPEKGQSLPTMIGNLVLWYRTSTASEDLVDCSECGGDSDARLPACPYCGDSEVEQAEAPAQPAPKVSTPSAGEVKTSAAKVREAKAKKVEAAPEPKEEPLPESEPEPEVVETEGEEADDELAPESGTVVVDKGALQVEELDAAVAKLQQLRSAASMHIWEMGIEFEEIHRRELWSKRVRDGKRAYKSFAQFCTAELGMSYTHVKRLIDIAKAFPRDQVEALGVGKCNVMLTLPPEQRQRLASTAANKSVRALSADAQALKDGEQPAARTQNSITVALAPGVVEIPLMARPKRNQRKHNDQPAKSVSDDPTGVEQLANKVQCHYSLVKNTAGDLVLRVERRRVNEGALFASDGGAED